MAALPTMTTFLHFVPHGLARAARGFWPEQALRRPVAAALAVLATAGLLAAFGQVLREAVQQGQQRREATARHSVASWHCASMRSLQLRDACLVELNTTPPQDTLPAAPP